MEVYSIQVGDKYILYRPLLRLAFVGNGAMARLATRLASESQASVAQVPGSVREYLASIGFLEPDPPLPESREWEYQPTNAVLLMTNRCNLRCLYCYASAGEGTAQEVTVPLARAAIDHAHQNALDLGRSQFALTFHGGGEPILAWKTMQEAVRHARAKELSCRISMVSNGVWSKRQADWVVHNLDTLTISLDGDQETQNRQRPLAVGQGSFARVMETIRALDRHGFDYGIRMTALPPWRGQLAQDVQFICRETGCRSIQVEPAFNSQRGGYRPPGPEEGQAFVAGFMQALEVAEQEGRRMYFSGARPWLSTSVFCTAPYGALIVTPAGDLVTCYEITDSGHPLAETCTVGQIRDGRVVVDGEKRRGILARLEARREGCRDCFCYWHCAGDCHAKTFYPGIDTKPGSSPRCQMNRSIMTEMLLWYVAAADDGVYRWKRVDEEGMEE